MEKINWTEYLTRSYLGTSQQIWLAWPFFQKNLSNDRDAGRTYGEHLQFPKVRWLPDLFLPVRIDGRFICSTFLPLSDALLT